MFSLLKTLVLGCLRLAPQLLLLGLRLVVALFTLLRMLVGSFLRRVAQSMEAQKCPICFDDVPAAGKVKVSDRTQKTHVKFSCRHKFCMDCIRPYVEMKVKAREVNDDQLVCPVLECKRTLTESDIACFGDHALLRAYTSNKKQVLDERNPNARWCPRPSCGKLTICGRHATTFTCTTCATKGCVRCRGLAHGSFFARFFCRPQTEDESYRAWEESVGSDQAIRSCPKCQMRIWKADGCNHMTCTSCRHQFCWVCRANWASTHYQCTSSTQARQPTEAVAPLGAFARMRHWISQKAADPIMAYFTTNVRNRFTFDTDPRIQNLFYPGSGVPSMALFVFLLRLCGSFELLVYFLVFVSFRRVPDTQRPGN